MATQIKINPIVKTLLLSDVFFYIGWGLVQPLMALFIIKNIQNGDAVSVGWSTAIYWLTFSVLRVPFGLFLDNKEGEKDDYFFLTFGLLLAALVAFGFIFANRIWHLYLLQFMHGLGMAMSLAGWSAIFQRHLDPKLESTEFGISSSSVALVTALSAVLGGWILEKTGSFVSVFAVVGLFGMAGVAVLLLIANEFKGDFRPEQYLLLLFKRETWQKFLEKSSLIREKVDHMS
ncbi:MAG: MFS transporter [Candidatus Paceibacterota bacterium]